MPPRVPGHSLAKQVSDTRFPGAGVTSRRMIHCSAQGGRGRAGGWTEPPGRPRRVRAAGWASSSSRLTSRRGTGISVHEEDASAGVHGRDIRVPGETEHSSGRMHGE